MGLLLFFWHSGYNFNIINKPLHIGHSSYHQFSVFSDWLQHGGLPLLLLPLQLRLSSILLSDSQSNPLLLTDFLLLLCDSQFVHDHLFAPLGLPAQRGCITIVPCCLIGPCTICTFLPRASPQQFGFSVLPQVSHFLFCSEIKFSLLLLCLLFLCLSCF